MFRKTKVCSGLMLAFGGGLMLGALPANAQQQLERVEITGSSIKRVSGEGALPVQTFSQEDIKRSGVTSVTDFIQQMTVMQGFTMAADSVGGSGGGITTASIHDVGEQYTLVLLNGRRIAPATSGTTIDLNSIPLSAIERIEVLTDGASALYGADAIAGVVNFILKKGAAPFEITARVDKPQHSGGGGHNFSISKGFGDIATDGYSVFAAFGIDKTKRLKAKDREFAKSGIIQFKDQQGRNLTFFNGSTRSVPPNVDVRYNDPTKPATASGNSVVSFSPYQELNGNCPPDHVAGGRQCVFDYTSTVEINPEQERKSFFASGELKLGGTGFKGFADVGYTDASIIARIAPYPAEFSLAASHPYFATYVDPYLTPTQRANLTSVNVKYRLYDMGNRAYDYRTKATHVVAGVEGAALGWDLNTAFTISKQKQLQDYVGGFPLADKFNDALNNQLVDPFPYTLGTMPPEQLAALNATQFKGTYNTTDIKMIGADLRGSREIFKIGSGAASLGLGADFRETGYKVTANPAVANAEILFDDPQPEYDLKRKSAGAFAELLVPLTQDLEVTGGARFDSISGVDDARSGKKFGSTQTASTFKLSSRYQPTKDMLVRGSYGTGFRSATMREIAQPQVDFGVTSGTYACPFNAGYDPLGYAAAGYVCDDGTQKEVFQGGNPDLKPEKSKQWTLGFVLEPSRDVTIGLDLWNVEIKNSVSSVSEVLILTEPEKYLDLYTTKFKASNGLTYVAIKDQPINIGRLENQGLDWDFQVRGKTDWGNVTGRVSGTYMIKSRYTKPGTDDQFVTSLGQFGVNDAVTFRNVFKASGTLNSGNWTNTLTFNFRSGYRDAFQSAENCVVDDGVDCVDVQLDVPRYYTWDWQTRWNATKNFLITLGVTNIADRDPPLSLRTSGAGHQLGYDPRYASAIGRAYYISGSLKF
jgi:iron complex outermembrane receptor protein